MKYVELSSSNVEEETIELYKKIIKDFKYDLVVFVAKGSYSIGKKLSELNDCPLIEINATRKGNKLKKILAPFLKIIPKKIKIVLRKKEFNSNVHEANSERKVVYNKDIWKLYKDCKKILLIDDSIDTGYSIKSCEEVLKSFFPDSVVKIAGLNFFEKSSTIVHVDYYIFKNTMLNGPWSNDSKYHHEFLNEYYNWKNEYEKRKI